MALEIDTSNCDFFKELFLCKQCNTKIAEYGGFTNQRCGIVNGWFVCEKCMEGLRKAPFQIDAEFAKEFFLNIILLSHFQGC